MTPYFSIPERIADLRAAAAAWEGTPFRDHWRSKKQGVDCIGLAAAIYTECGHLAEFECPAYTIGAWKGVKESPVLKWVGNSQRFVGVTDGTRQPGDLLCFTQGRTVYHIGIYLDEGSQLFVHAIAVDGVCKRTLSDPTWAKRLVATYRPVIA